MEQRKATEEDTPHTMPRCIICSCIDGHAKYCYHKSYYAEINLKRLIQQGGVNRKRRLSIPPNTKVLGILDTFL